MTKGKSVDFVRRLELLASFAGKRFAYVGIPQEAGEHEGGIRNATLGYLFEYGDPATNMPPRPWLLPGVALVEDRIAEELAAGFQRGMRHILGGGTMTQARAEITKSQHKVGLIAQGAIQRRIQAGIAPPLSPRTVYARMHRKSKRRSGGEMTPLYDTGAFIRSITYVIR